MSAITEEHTANANSTPGCLQRRDIAPPEIFISSTFEDLLTEIRDRLKTELEDVNLLPIMSELGTFKYTYHQGSVVNDTIQAAATADFFILVIGRQYGSIDETGKSITEQEYEAAQAAGIPTLVYVHDKVWDGYDAFRAGAVDESNFDHWVADFRVLTFINRVAAVDTHRCLPFHNAREIIEDFRCQVANLFGGFLRFESRAASWLWTEEYTREVERTAEVVWILTPNFFWDYADPDFRKLVNDNITTRETVYYYLYQKTGENERRVGEMASDYQAAFSNERWRDLVHYASIPAEDFGWCTEQAMYDPGDPLRERGIIVDIMDERDKINKCNIELGREKRADFRRQFTRLWYLYGEGELRGAAFLPDAATAVS